MGNNRNITISCAKCGESFTKRKDVKNKTMCNKCSMKKEPPVVILHVDSRYSIVCANIIKDTCWKSKVVCSCGNEEIVISSYLKTGRKLMCAKCSLKEKGYKNRKYKTDIELKISSVLSSMKTRCYSKTSTPYQNYGGRGILICEEWLSDSMSFIQWAIENGYKSGLTIDRIDNNDGYSPLNCRWVSMKEQEQNRRDNVLTPELAKQIRDMRAKFIKYSEIQSILGVSKCSINSVMNKNTWL